jgi:hypothetical protein
VLRIRSKLQFGLGPTHVPDMTPVGMLQVYPKCLYRLGALGPMRNSYSANFSRDWKHNIRSVFFHEAGKFLSLGRNHIPIGNQGTTHQKRSYV